MIKKSKIPLIIFIILVIVAILVFAIYYTTSKKVEMKAVVVRVYDKSLTVMEIEDTKSLISVGFTKEGNIGFERGQEVAINYSGGIMESYPAQLSEVKKIKITEQKSDVEIPEEIIKFCYNSVENVKYTIEELTDSGITFTITDTNELPYTYGHRYSISKKTENQTQGYVISESSGNFTGSYSGTGPIWSILETNSNIPSEDTEQILFTTTQNNKFVQKRKIDWTPLYGKLKSGEYEFSFDNDIMAVGTSKIGFKIDSNGEITTQLNSNGLFGPIIEKTIKE